MCCTQDELFTKNTRIAAQRKSTYTITITEKDKSLPNNIRILRKQKKLSSKALSALVGCSTVALYNWEMGKAIPKPKNRKKLEQILGTEIEGLSP
ncbi:MAG: helix-turn-helix domain-containing protein [gamma proteobacterium symbiont of Taylorina sp.]|nr:helix-turn-helix domain-containing protein [gamma proteobacterium symbiont of Taylorina sp.]